MELNGRKVAVLAADDYEDLELWYPYYRMKEAGAASSLRQGDNQSARIIVNKNA